MFAYLLGVVVLFITYQTGNALQCYQCQFAGLQNQTSPCKYPMNETAFTPVNCTKSNVVLSAPFKSVDQPRADDFSCFAFELEYNNIVTTQRGCANAANTKDACKNIASGAMENATVNLCRVCDSDGCNSANQYSISVLLLGLFALVQFCILSC